MEIEGIETEKPRPLQKGTDSCSDSPQAKRARVDKNDDSGEHNGVDAMHVSRVETGVDASNKPMIGYSESNQVERNEMHVSRMRKGMGRDVEHSILDDHIPPILQGRTVLSAEREYADIALEYYEKKVTQDAKFEVLEVLFSNRAAIVIPGAEGLGVGPWCHVSFTAKPKNSDNLGQHFFCEMVLDHDLQKYKVTYCTIFKPNDPGNVYGCVFCPVFEVYLHPPNGCPAGAQEKDHSVAQKGTDASEEQILRCSKRHRSRPNVYLNADTSRMLCKAQKALNLQHAKTALEFFENNKDAEFEVVEVLQAINKRVVAPGSKSIEEWYHVCFIAKPRNFDCIDFSSKHFFGELLRDPTTGKYNATYCEIFKPSDRKVTHNCIICPQLSKHPFKGYRVGRPPHSIAEDE